MLSGPAEAQFIVFFMASEVMWEVKGGSMSLW